jgi:hypothetical protein
MNLRLAELDWAEWQIHDRTHRFFCEHVGPHYKPDTLASTDSCQSTTRRFWADLPRHEAERPSYVHYPDDGRHIEGEFPLPNSLSRHKPDNGDVVADRKAVLVFYLTSTARNLTRDRPAA